MAYGSGRRVEGVSPAGSGRRVSGISPVGSARRVSITGAAREGAVGLIFPRRCPVCGDIVRPKGRLICPECVKRLSYVSGATCLKCGKELTDQIGEYCLGCSRHRRTFDRGVALLNYNEVSADSMVQIKYKNKREYLDFYSDEIVRRLGGKLARMKADVLMPVPVHPSRKRARGYNQAEELAKRLSGLMGIPLCTDVLVRTRKTLPQKELTPQERLKNLEQAFGVREEALDTGIRSVLLVDDIYTTGSTMEACARVLKRAGIQRVYFVSVCIGGDR